MFRRNKNKSSKSRDEAMVSLTGGDALSSSSTFDAGSPKGSGGKGGGGGGSRFIAVGRRKKKVETDAADDVVSSASPTVISSAAGGGGGGGDASNGGRPNQGGRSQPQNVAQQQAQALAATARRPQTKTAPNGSTLPSQQPRPQQQQQPARQPAEIRDESENSNAVQRGNPQQQMLYSNNRHPFLPPSSDPSGAMAGLGGNYPLNGAPYHPNAAVEAGGAAMKPPPQLLAMNGSSRHQANGTAAVPMKRSGWSMQSNASSAMNSEHYIQSLDNLPSARSGKVSSLMFRFIQGLRSNCTL